MNPVVLETGSRPLPPTVTARNWTRRSWVLLGAVLLLSAVVLVHGIHQGEFSYNVDETQHAMTGFFAADVIRDHPVRHPLEYAYEYYAQYPALSGIIHWPPLFYLFEGVGFLVFGPTVVTARLVIVFFALWTIALWFLLVREVQDEWMAAVASLLLACAPSVLLFEKSVMLEIPCLAFCVAATLFWTRYLLRENPADAYYFALCASAAALTKQNAVYLIPFCLFSGFAIKGWAIFRSIPVWRAIAIGALVTAPFYWLVYLVHWKTVAMDLAEKGSSKVAAASFYWRAVPEQVGWTIFLLMILGLITCFRWTRSKVTAIMLSWIAACYLTFTLIGHKEARYSMYWIPPFTFFAVGPLTSYFRKQSVRIAGDAAAILLIGTSLVYAWNFQRPYVSGYEALAEKVTQISTSGVILFDGPLPGNFIFFLRANDGGRRFVVLRKALYVSRIKQSGGVIELVHNQDDIEQLIRAYGVRFFIVSDGVPLKFESQKILRAMLAEPNFREMGSFPIAGLGVAPDLRLLLYENAAWAPATEKFLRIKMLTLDHDIVVPMDRYRLNDPLSSNNGERQAGGAQ